MATLVAGSLLGVGLLSGPWFLLLPFALVVGLGTTVLYLTSSVLLLEAMPAARGAVLALQTGTFEAGWALGAASAGGLLAFSVGYPTIYKLFGLLLLLSLGFLALSAHRPRPALDPRLVAPAAEA
jgi:predicted MFS family arabinose efflux permease